MHSIEALNWRYAVKHYDPTKKLSDEQLDTLTAALRLTPSAFGIQPWKFFVISNPEIRAKLRAAGYDQPQITDASQIIVFTVSTKLDDAAVDHYVQSIAAARSIPVEALAGLSTMLKGRFAGMTQEQKTAWATKQAYIALGVLIATAAQEHIDAGGMEGFDPAQFDEILGLKEKSLTTVVIAPVGFRLATDEGAAIPKFRFPKGEVVEEVK